MVSITHFTLTILHYFFKNVVRCGMVYIQWQINHSWSKLESNRLFGSTWIDLMHCATFVLSYPFMEKIWNPILFSINHIIYLLFFEKLRFIQRKKKRTCHTKTDLNFVVYVIMIIRWCSEHKILVKLREITAKIFEVRQIKVVPVIVPAAIIFCWSVFKSQQQPNGLFASTRSAASKY